MKLLIAIPTNDYMHYQFCECLTKLVRRLDEDEIDYDIAFQGATLVYVGRDKLAQKAMDECYTHVLWLDSDMISRFGHNSHSVWPRYRGICRRNVKITGFTHTISRLKMEVYRLADISCFYLII